MQININQLPKSSLTNKEVRVHGNEMFEVTTTTSAVTITVYTDLEGLDLCKLLVKIKSIVESEINHYK